MDPQNRPQGEPYVGYKSRFGPTWQELHGTATPPTVASPPPPQVPPPAATQVGRREIAEVEAVIANMDRTKEKWPQYSEAVFHQGARAAFLWALGRGPAPLTQVPGPPDLAALRAEDNAAQEEIDHPSRRPPRKDFWAGVQHATMWLLGESDECPWSMVLNLD